MRWNLSYSLAVLSCLTGILLNCHRSLPPDRFMARYLALHRTHQIEALLDLHTADTRFFLPGQTPIVGREALRALLEWDRELDSRLWMGGIHQKGDTIVVDAIVEKNAFFQALGVDSVRYRPGTRFVLRGGKIALTAVAPLDEASRNAGLPAFLVFKSWLAQHFPDTLQHLLPGGRFRYNAQSARLWLKMLKRWRKETGQDRPQ
ncbi:MAG: nuclear transport factor 2 family protein [Calditrichaeota bacterium]|nr:MAG: nuclear transport factor 2 family protein [Calditrichota bacterium]